MINEVVLSCPYIFLGLILSVFSVVFLMNLNDLFFFVDDRVLQDLKLWEIIAFDILILNNSFRPILQGKIPKILID